ncbi:MAG: DsrE family protein [Chloroflexi bacterium]|nr:DsrE family protein [Chloroflexota bacterium]
MNNSLCILIRRPPYGQIHAAEAIRHAGGALAEGLVTRVALIDDGVYVARAGQDTSATAWTALAPALAKTIEKGAPVLVHLSSAIARGLAIEKDFVAGAQIIDDAEFMRVIAASDAVMIY